MPKIEMTEDTKEWTDPAGNKHTLHRARLLEDLSFFPLNIHAGTVGGWIERLDNIYPHGSAWVRGEAIVAGRSRIYDGSTVSGTSIVWDSNVLGCSTIVDSKVLRCDEIYSCHLRGAGGMSFASGSRLMRCIIEDSRVERCHLSEYIIGERAELFDVRGSDSKIFKAKLYNIGGLYGAEINDKVVVENNQYGVQVFRLPRGNDKEFYTLTWVKTTDKWTVDVSEDTKTNMTTEELLKWVNDVEDEHLSHSHIPYMLVEHVENCVKYIERFKKIQGEREIEIGRHWGTLSKALSDLASPAVT